MKRNSVEKMRKLKDYIEKWMVGQKVRGVRE